MARRYGKGFARDRRPPASGAGRAGHRASARALRRRGIVRSGCMCRSACCVPTVAVVDRRLQELRAATSRFRTSTSPRTAIYLHGLLQSIQLSVLSSVLPGSSGCCRLRDLHRPSAARSSPGRDHRLRACSPTSAASRWRSVHRHPRHHRRRHAGSRMSVRPVRTTASPVHPQRRGLVYMYFQIPLMVLVILPALEGLRPHGGRRPRTWARGAGSTGATSAARCCCPRSSAACCCCSAALSPPTPPPRRSPAGDSADPDPDRVVPERQRDRRPGEPRQGARPTWS